MPLSYVTEYLLSYFDQSGNAHIFQNSQRVAIAGLIPNGRSENNVSVPLGKHSIIVYRVDIDPAVVPLALNMTFLVNGNPIYDNVLGSPVILNPIDCFAWIKAGNPGRLTIVNNAFLAQNFEAVIWYLTILNETDYDLVLNVLKRISSVK
ncbi:MAG: hypothetical protein PHN44_00700 [Candidatus Marinimicrobia bacterium]|nr:hypothetical protein [Candidatus Neomarinimicrobiota bacterium]MDD5539115.1 hypothetical protein [Candidatus Neomarinimicrobiota bacterium]